MPLFLLYLSNIGDIMAKSFKWIYAKVCLCRICPGVAKRREARMRRKIRALQRQLNDEYYNENVSFLSINYSMKLLIAIQFILFRLILLQEDYDSNEVSSVTSSSSTLKNQNEYENESNAKNELEESSSTSSQSSGDDLTNVSVPISVCLMIMIR